VPRTIDHQYGLSGFFHTNDGALAIGQPHVAATWYPVNDHPSDPATYTVAVTVPAGLVAISNGVLEEHTGSTFTWRSAEPMPSYLVGSRSARSMSAPTRRAACGSGTQSTRTFPSSRSSTPRWPGNPK
jgi:aminopeptidase N